MVGTHIGSDLLQSVISSIISVSVQAPKSIVFTARSPYLIVKLGNYNFINAGTSVLLLRWDILHPAQGILWLTPLGERGGRKYKGNSLFLWRWKTTIDKGGATISSLHQDKKPLLYGKIESLAATDSFFSLEKYWFKCSQNLKRVHNHVLCKKETYDLNAFDGRKVKFALCLVCENTIHT